MKEGKYKFTRLDQYDEWASQQTFNKPDGTFCKHGRIEGGPGYVGFGRCELTDVHPNVRYGCERCPADCKDYEFDDDSAYRYYCSCVLDNSEEQAKRQLQRDEAAFYSVSKMLEN